MRVNEWKKNPQKIDDGRRISKWSKAYTWKKLLIEKGKNLYTYRWINVYVNLSFILHPPSSRPQSSVSQWVSESVSLWVCESVSLWVSEWVRQCVCLCSALRGRPCRGWECREDRRRASWGASAERTAASAATSDTATSGDRDRVPRSDYPSHHTRTCIKCICIFSYSHTLCCTMGYAFLALGLNHESDCSIVGRIISIRQVQQGGIKCQGGTWLQTFH